MIEHILSFGKGIYIFKLICTRILIEKEEKVLYKYHKIMKHHTVMIDLNLPYYISISTILKFISEVCSKDLWYSFFHYIMLYVENDILNLQTFAKFQNKNWILVFILFHQMLSHKTKTEKFVCSWKSCIENYDSAYTFG